MACFAARAAGVLDGHNQIDLQADQLGGEIGEALGASLGIPPLDGDVVTIDVPEITKPLKERVKDGRERMATGR